MVHFLLLPLVHVLYFLSDLVQTSLQLFVFVRSLLELLHFVIPPGAVSGFFMSNVILIFFYQILTLFPFGFLFPELLIFVLEFLDLRFEVDHIVIYFTLLLLFYFLLVL